MKKLIIIAAIGAASAIPMTAMSDTTLYGELDYSFNNVDEDRANGAASINGWRGEDNTSLFGLKGSYGDDVKAFFHLQTGARSDNPSGGPTSGNAFDQRFFFGGLSGKFGKVAYGKMTNAYKFPGFKLDPFYNKSHVGAGGTFARGGATYGLSPATNAFTDNSLQYVTPTLGTWINLPGMFQGILGGLKLNGGVYVDDGNGDRAAFGGGFIYEGGSWDVGAQYAKNGDTVAVVLPGIAADGDAWRVHGSYKADRWSVATSYENIAIPVAGGRETVNYLYLTGQFKVTPKARLVASPGYVGDGPAEGWGITAGVFYAIAPHTTILLSGSYVDRNDNNEVSVYTINATHKFNLEW